MLELSAGFDSTKMTPPNGVHDCAYRIRCRCFGSITQEVLAMKPSVGAVEAEEVRRPLSAFKRFYYFLYAVFVSFYNILLEPLSDIFAFSTHQWRLFLGSLRQWVRIHAERSGHQVSPCYKERVQSKDLITGRFLGQGCSGIFYETAWSGSQGSTVRLARKDFPGVKGDIFESEVIRLFVLEDHPNIVKNFCWTVDNRSCSLVMEYVREDLSSVVRKRKEALRKMGNQPVIGISAIQFQLLEAMDILLQIAIAIKYLHDEGIAHGDLKPSNVLIDWSKKGRMLVKVADFGLIETKRGTTLISQRAQCFRMIEWSAPELIGHYFGSISEDLEDLDDLWTTSPTGSNMNASSASYFDKNRSKISMSKADSYSFGLMCAYILGGQMWDAKMSPNELRERISRSSLRPTLPFECPEKLASLISKCWDANPTVRPTFSDIRNKLQEITKEQREKEAQRDTRNMLQEIIKEQRESETRRHQEALRDIHIKFQEIMEIIEKQREQDVQQQDAQQDAQLDVLNELQEIVKEQQEAQQDIRNKLQDFVKEHQDIRNELQELLKEHWDFSNKLQEIVKERRQQVEEDYNSLKSMELVGSNSPISEALDPDSSKMAYPAPDPDVLLRKRKAWLSKNKELKESIPNVLPCTEERETFKEIPNQLQTYSRPDDLSPSDQFRGDYNVFLNHRGPDVKFGFLAHLEEALKSAGLNPFVDKKILMKEVGALRSIDDALKVAKIYVAIVSSRYAESKYCLRELVVMMRSGKPVIPVFYDVEPAQLLWVENGPFAAAFEKHKSREAPEQVEEWADALRKLATITGLSKSNYMGNEAKLKRKVVDAVLRLIPTNRKALQVDFHLVGAEEHVNICINKLEKMSGATCLLCLVGMGGIGKTSLAKEIYHHFVSHKNFQAMSFLVIDHNSPSSMKVGLSLLQKQLLWDLLHVSTNNQQNYMFWFHKLSSQGPVLIVLDNIHDKFQFDELIPSTSLLAPGSCIIVTSRDLHLLKVVAGKSNFYLHEVTPLGCDDSIKLFNLHAFGNEEAPHNFEALAHDVSKACGGLPLALKVVGSSLFDKTSDEDQKCIWPNAIGALKEDPNVMNSLKWSYNCLSKSEQLMFVDIACIFYGWKVEDALEIWKACKNCSSCHGLETPYNLLRHLIDQSLVMLEYSLEGDVLAMHGLLQNMGQAIGKIDGSHLMKDRAAKSIENKSLGQNKVRALNLSNSQKFQFEAENFANMPNLHFLILDGCDVSNNLQSISKELRWLQWRYMPLIHQPPLPNLSNLISLDFSQSAELANAGIESNSALEACPNLLRLNLSDCISITTLPDSIGHLLRLQVLELRGCRNLQKLPCAVGQLRELQLLNLEDCGSLEALPDTVTSLSGLQRLYMKGCSSIFKLPTTIRYMSGLTCISIDLATTWQANAIGQLNALKKLTVMRCTNEVNTVVDSSGALRNLDQLIQFNFFHCKSITKLPETIGLLTNLQELQLFSCKKLEELPESIGRLRVLKTLDLRECSSLKTLPDSLGALTCLQYLLILQCTSITKLPMSIGLLSSLLIMKIQGCSELQSIPESIRQLNALEYFTITDCGRLENFGVLTVLQGLRIWGCTSITEFAGSCLTVLDSKSWDPACSYGVENSMLVHQNLKELQMLEVNGCGFLRLVQDTQNARLILQRVHKSPCCKLTM